VLFYLRPDGWLISVTIDPTGAHTDGPVRPFAIGKPSRQPLMPNVMGNSHHVPLTGGQGFLVIVEGESNESPKVVTNWRDVPVNAN
jgi:hypothetical protein